MLDLNWQFRHLLLILHFMKRCVRIKNYLLLSRRVLQGFEIRPIYSGPRLPVALRWFDVIVLPRAKFLRCWSTESFLDKLCHIRCPKSGVSLLVRWSGF